MLDLFFRQFFRFGVLDEAGEDSFTRALIGVVAAVLGCGLLLARVLLIRYRALADASGPAAYQQALLADQLLIICIPMLVVAVVMALASDRLFPDELDFRVLMPLPVTRGRVFTAKLGALILFSSFFAVGASVGTGVPFVLVSTGRWTMQPIAARMLTQLVATLGASVFTIVSIVAVQGLILAASPPRWRRGVAVAVRTAFICALTLSLPLLARIPALSTYLAGRPRALLAAPPAWFLGIQEWMLGNREPYFESLAAAAIAGTAATALIGIACYLLVYRRFDLVVLSRPEMSRVGGEARGTAIRWSFGFLKFLPSRRHPAYGAIHRFMAATLRRSALHQLAALGLFAVGVAFVLDDLISIGPRERRWVVAAAFGIPLPLMVAAAAGLRAAMLLPTTLRAAWVFKLTENPESRLNQLDAVRHAWLALGVVVPAALALPIQASVLGVRIALVSAPVALLLGNLMIETMARDWRRIPFTCTLLFAKRPQAYTLLLIFVAFFFVTVGGGLMQAASSGPRGWLIAVAILALLNRALRWHRLQSWGQHPLEFEDHLPNSLETLDLRVQ